MSFMRLPPFKQALAACVLLAGVDALIKAAAADVSVLQIVNARYVLGSLVLLMSAGWAGAIRLGRREVHTALLRGVLFVASAGLFFYALAELALSTAVLLGFTAPVWIAIMSATALGEPLELRAALAIGIAFAGVALFAYGQLEAGRNLLARDGVPALLAGIAAPVIYACATVGFKRGVTESNFNGAMLVQTAAAGIVSLPAWFIGARPVSPGILGSLVLIGIGATVGQLLYLQALSKGSAARIAATEYTTLPWAFVLGAMFFSEMPRRIDIFASLLIIAGCALASKACESASGPVSEGQ